MIFNSYTFLVFLCVVLTLHYLPFFSWRIKKFNLLWLSYLFYASWNPPFVLLLVFSTIVDWFLGRALYAQKTAFKRKAFLILSLIVNLGLLSYFKYGGFILGEFQGLMQAAGYEYVPPAMDVILPVGISFYTFQTLSYTIDIYRGHLKPWNSFLDYAMYVTFFPQLVAGPIVRAADFLPQCQTPRYASQPQFFWGLGLLILGMFQKVVMADTVFAGVADDVYAMTGSISPLAAWTGTIAFTGQIFCDFAGYSTAAIGVAMMLGFALPDNFRFPYAAIGFSDFWRRWHISLSTWLRDYLYIPLGGNRKGRIRTHINLAITMLLGGLWHGAAWTFVIWGALHGLYLIAERYLTSKFSYVTFWKTRIGQFMMGSATFICVVLAWVFFRATSFDQAVEFISAMFTFGGGGKSVDSGDVAQVLIVMGILMGTHIYMRGHTLESAIARIHPVILSVITAVMLYLIYLFAGDYRAFIYFQF